jgi:SAM-dependent methyltransferase
MWDKGWDKIFLNNAWGKYPDLDLVRFFSRRFKNNKKVRVLEIGCGTGANLSFFDNEKIKSFGCDGSSVAINKAKKLIKKRKGLSKAIIADLTNLPFKNNSFDFVFDIECLYCNDLSGTQSILNEVIRVLKKRGVFFSKTFSTKISGVNKSKKFLIGKNIYSKILHGPLHSGYSPIRLVAEEDIKKIYKNFKNIKYDISYRTDDNRKMEISEWLIYCEK